MPIDLDSFRTGMRWLASGVCLITTTDADGARCGLTATAVCSVSASPPTLLCCINRSNSSHAAIRQSGIFTVNVLSCEDRALADRFASRIGAQEKFAEGLWCTMETGAPALESALASFDCRIAHAVEVATHGILFGEIQAVRVRNTSAKPLLYAQGAYGGFASLAAARGPDLTWVPTWEYEEP
jgi:flavin reductase (DIM6/NTAB) family NADH-FMN oxidoreductase RutF